MDMVSRSSSDSMESGGKHEANGLLVFIIIINRLML